MKRFLLLLLLMLAGNAFAQPILRNTFTTNANSLGTGYGALVLSAGVPLGIASSATNVFLRSQGSGSFPTWSIVPGTDPTAPINIFYATNISVTNLTATTINATTITNVSNFYATNSYVVNGNHNTLIVTNALTLNSLKTNLLAVTSTGLITNANYGTGLAWNPATLTLSASGGGGSVSVNATNVTTPNLKDTADITWAIAAATNAQPSFAPLTWNALTYSASNVVMDCSLGNSYEAHYKLVLTNSTTQFGLPTSIPSTPKTYWIWLQQDSTGVRTVQWTNAATGFKFPGATQPVITTNANAQTLIMFATGPFTNSVLNYVGIVPQIQ